MSEEEFKKRIQQFEDEITSRQTLRENLAIDAVLSARKAIAIIKDPKIKFEVYMEFCTAFIEMGWDLKFLNDAMYGDENK